MNKLICPVCLDSLKRTDDHKSMVCAQGHLFDFAKQGYINLLLSHQKKSKQPGDNADMVAARRDFLNGGHYQGLANNIVKLICELETHARSSETLCFTDIGCGEGYYTTMIHWALEQQLSPANALAAHSPPLISSGVDVSAHAIKAACKRSKALQWIIGNGHRLPIENHSQDLASCLFCRPDFSEAARILKPGGHFITVNSGAKHLIELREALYEKVKVESNQIAEQHDTPEGLSSQLQHQAQHVFKNVITLNSSQHIRQCLMMTPHYWRASPAKKKQLEALEKLELTLDVVIDHYQTPDHAR